MVLWFSLLSLLSVERMVVSFSDLLTIGVIQLFIPSKTYGLFLLPFGVGLVSLFNEFQTLKSTDAIFVQLSTLHTDIHL